MAMSFSSLFVGLDLWDEYIFEIVSYKKYT